MHDAPNYVLRLIARSFMLSTSYVSVVCVSND